MSAFLVADETINKIVRFMREDSWLVRGLQQQWRPAFLHYNLAHLPERKRLADDLFAMNIRGVEARYGSGKAKKFRSLNFQFDDDVEVPTPIQALKSLRCLIYQCTEGNVDEEPLYQMLESISGFWAHDIVNELPEYRLADWG